MQAKRTVEDKLQEEKEQSSREAKEKDEDKDEDGEQEINIDTEYVTSKRAIDTGCQQAQ
jgi:hypothetical protein